ncbi:PepSY domain-containing protein [Paenibacillus yanchengensis]|uniref:PepSY domain-containing protein n=1 Tax=Paenibacillus yanchengensis TaxID=2035833 RepID=A0ABW4YNQ1_9BACL
MMRMKWNKLTITSVVIVVAVVMVIFIKPWKGNAEQISAQAATDALLNQYAGEVKDVLKSGNAYIMKLQTKQGMYEVEVDAVNGDVVALQLLESAVVEGIDEATAIEIAQAEVGKLQNNDDPIANITSTNAPPREPSISNKDDDHDDGNRTSSVETNRPTAVNKEPTATSKPVATRRPEHSKQPNKQANKPVSAATEKVKNKESTKETVNKTTWLSKEKAGKLAKAHMKGKIEDIDFYKPHNGQAYYLVELDINRDKDAIVQVNAVSGAIMSVVWDNDDDDGDKHNDDKHKDDKHKDDDDDWDHNNDDNDDDDDWDDNNH